MPEVVEVASELVTVRLDAEKGSFDIFDGEGQAVVAGAAVGVVLGDGLVHSSRQISFGVEAEHHLVEDAVGRGRALSLQVDLGEGRALQITVTVYDGQPFVVLDCELLNNGSGPVRIARFDVPEGTSLRLGSPPATWWFYKHGWQSWSPTLVLDCAGADLATTPPVTAPGTRPEVREGRFLSELMTAIVSPESGQGIVAGFITTADQVSQLWLDREGGTLTAASYADGVIVPLGGRLSSERLLIEPTRVPLEAMERYGDALARAMGARASATVVTGWCSWYHYWQGVSEEAILVNLPELARRRDELPMKYVQIDDGWQAGIGDWLAVNDKFPRGLKWLVERIHEAGFKAGLWLAPFLIGEKSRLWREHPDWAVQYRPGKPLIAMQNWGQDCYALDLTRPEVIEWLTTVFGTVCDEWGFDYVKIDFIYAGAVDGIRADPEVTRAQAYRRGLEAIREAVGRRFILGCGNPMGASIGIVDGARISPDVAPFWRPPGDGGRDQTRMSEPSALNAIRNTMTRWWMHRRLWQNDPDCVLVRDIETALTADEVRTLATVIAMSGGMVLDSDDLTRLSDERREWLSMLLPPYGRAARPLDLFGSEVPRILELDCDTHKLLGLFNWSDEAATIEAPLPAGSVSVVDAWSRENLGVRRGSIEFEVPPHGCRLLSVRAVDSGVTPAGGVLPPLFRWPGG